MQGGHRNTEPRRRGGWKSASRAEAGRASTTVGVLSSLWWAPPPGSKTQICGPIWRHCCPPREPCVLCPPTKALMTPGVPVSSSRKLGTRCELSRGLAARRSAACWVLLAPEPLGPEKREAAPPLPWPCPGNPRAPGAPGAACAAGRPHPWGPAEAAGGPVSGGGSGQCRPEHWARPAAAGTSQQKGRLGPVTYFP